MNKWIKEEWSFRVEVTDGYAKDCRLGLKKVMFFLLNTKLRMGFVPVQYLKFIHTVKSFAAEEILHIGVQKKSIR